MNSGPPEHLAGGRLTIDLSAIAANFRFMAARASPAECAAVVKANAYGLGARPVAQALWDADARTFFVALLQEAVEIRAVLPTAAIYVLNGLPPGASSAFAEIDARPVLGSLNEIEEWAAYCAAAGWPGSAAIHVDTGMNRLGLARDDAEIIAQRYRDRKLGFAPSLLMSHLACADEPDHPLNRRQVEAFRAVASMFPGLRASLANSAGTLSGPDFLFDLCRPGIALYGGNPLPGTANLMRPGVTLEARIVQIRKAAEGDVVGYGASQHLRRPSTLAVISAGYADGFPRAAGSGDTLPGAAVGIAGRPCPLVGRVSMDLIVVDITDLPPDAVSPGDFAALMDDATTADSLAEQAGTISYEVLTRLGRRYARRYVG